MCQSCMPDKSRFTNFSYPIGRLNKAIPAGGLVYLNDIDLTSPPLAVKKRVHEKYGMEGNVKIEVIITDNNAKG